MEEDFTGEPYLFILGVLTRGGGVLYEPALPALETSNQSEQFVIDVIFAQRQRRILLEYMALNERGGELFKKDFRKLLSLE